LQKNKGFIVKILHSFILFSVEVGGGTSDLIYKICKAQAKSGLKPTVLSGSYAFDQELADSLKGVDFHVEKTYLHKQGFSLMPGLVLWCRNNLHQYDVVHMHVYRTFQNLVLYYYCRKYNIPYVMDAHGSVPYFTRKNFTKKIFDKFIGKSILKNASVLLAETEVGVDEYVNLDKTINKDQVVILSPPFDTDEYLQLPKKGDFRKKYNISLDEKVISFLGRVHYIKGNDFLIKGFAEFAKSNQNSKLVIIGPDDGHMLECKEIVEDLGIKDRVVFTGFLGGEYKNSALVDSDIVVQLSRQEQGAWAPLEAVLCETPIVVTRHTGTGEDIKRMNAGYLVDFDDVSGLSAIFINIFDNYDLAMEKTLKAKQYIEQHLSFNYRVREYTDIYNNSIENKFN
jgi:glycosyltransferase involved in cell wall biosynthesis